MKRIALIALFLASIPLDAQIYDGRRPKSPSIWISGGAAAFSADGINDGGTRSSWDFSGTTVQYRAAIEKSIQNQTSIGIAVSYMNMPFTYNGNSPGGANSCTQCDAHMKFYNAAVTLHVGGGNGFHQVLEASAGVNNYRDFRRDADGLALEPLDGNIDPAFTFGYGFGFNFSPSQEVFVIQDYGIALHERDGLQNNQSNTLTMRTTRIGYRMGFGKRGPLR
ncbi:MAG: hypothetical protein H0W69_02235 [Gemmatimonadaceae bacterium]|nr:hypothetical protein [Gemmatimonadaceae bacterium]